MSAAEKYGRYYWCVETQKSVLHLFADGRYYWCVETQKSVLHLFADRIEVRDGALLFMRSDAEDEKPEQVIFAFGAGQWLHAYAASCIDGGAVAVEHWESKKK